MSLESTQTYTYTTFGGCDIRAMFAETVIANLQGVSYSVTREKAPLYVLGSVDPISISRGKRGIAGSLIFLTLDRQALEGFMNKQRNLYYRKSGDRYIPGRDSIAVNNSEFEGSSQVKPNYPDQLPPFDITLTAINESGKAMVMRILGVEIISNGSGVSVDDLNIEEQMTFICRGITSWAESKTGTIEPLDATS